MIIQFDLYKLLENITQFMLWMVVFKSIFIGGEYDFHNRLKYGKKYTEWYNKRQRFSDYIKQQESK